MGSTRPQQEIAADEGETGDPSECAEQTPDEPVRRALHHEGITGLNDRGRRDRHDHDDGEAHREGLTGASQSASAGISMTVSPPRQACTINGRLGSQRSSSAR